MCLTIFSKESMTERFSPAKSNSRLSPFAHVLAFAVVLLASYWLRRIPLQPDPELQGYLQLTTGFLAFVFAAVSFVRFQGTQDRISLMLGAGFLLSGAVLTVSSILFFQYL